MIVIDGQAVAARSFFGTHAKAPEYQEYVFFAGFIKALLSILTDLVQFDNEVVFCLDSKSWRKDVFPDYKAQRKGLKDRVFYADYLVSLEKIAADIKASLPIHVVRKFRYEADDLLAYYANVLPTTILVASDKDMVPLVAPPRVQLYNFNDSKLVTPDDPEAFLHTLICTGDTSDNIPSIVPKKPDGKPAFRFGKVTVGENYDYTATTTKGISQEFLDKQQKAGKLSEGQLKQMLLDYESNRELIDLSRSPVHDENFEPLPKLKFNSDEAQSFFLHYIPEHFDRHGFRIMEVMSRYGA